MCWCMCWLSFLPIPSAAVAGVFYLPFFSCLPPWLIRKTIDIRCSTLVSVQEFRCGLLAVVLLVSGGVSLMFSGEGSDNQADLPIEGFLLTLLSGMLAGLKWTLSQVSYWTLSQVS